MRPRLLVSPVPVSSTSAQVDRARAGSPSALDCDDPTALSDASVTDPDGWRSLKSSASLVGTGCRAPRAGVVRVFGGDAMSVDKLERLAHHDALGFVAKFVEPKWRNAGT